MSKLSIYEDRWINMVFEGKNKEYGAYQLRQESNKTMLIAFIVSLLFVTCLVSIPRLIYHLTLGNNSEIIIPQNTAIIIQVTNLHQPSQKTPKKLALPISKKKVIDDIKKEQLSNPEIVKPIDATAIIATKNENMLSNIQNTNETSTIVGTSTATPIEIGTPSIPANETIIISTNVLDKLPEFPGGIKKFYTYVGDNFEKPEFDVVKTVKIYVAFVIEKDGSMTDIQVKRDPGYGLGQEAIRVLKSLKTKWLPGIMNGKAVRTSYNLPIVVEMK